MQHTQEPGEHGSILHRIKISNRGTAGELMAALVNVPMDAILIDTDFDEETDDEVLIFQEEVMQ